MLIDLLLGVEYFRIQSLYRVFFFLNQRNHVHSHIFELLSFLFKLGLVLAVKRSSQLLVTDLFLFTLFILHSVFDDFILELLEQVQET